MTLRTTFSILLFLLVAQNSMAFAHTLAEADNIIIILLFIVILLLVLGGVILYYNRIITQRNVKLRRILSGLEAYRKMMDSAVLPMSAELKEALKQEKDRKAALAQSDSMDESQKFFVEMDARMTMEKPFSNPDFDHQSLIAFLGVTQEEFFKLLPHYFDPANMMAYINSRRAEYGAQLITDNNGKTMDDIAVVCGFKTTAAFTSAFKFAFGITPTDYQSNMEKLFKKQV